MNYIVANWKMDPVRLKEGRKLIKNMTSKSELVICPPFPFLALLKGSFQLGAQDCSWKKQGAFTGEVSPLLLKDMGVSYAIIGHSERRLHLGETDEMINKKLKAALSAGLYPIFCVGGRSKDFKREAAEMEAQLKNGLKNIAKKDAFNIIYVYEPVWAISSSKQRAARCEEVGRGIVYIRKTLNLMYGAKKAKVLYGGSVNEKNVQEFLRAGSQGVLVGAASLRPNFKRLIKEFDYGVKKAAR